MEIFIVKMQWHSGKLVELPSFRLPRAAFDSWWGFFLLRPCSCTNICYILLLTYHNIPVLAAQLVTCGIWKVGGGGSNLSPPSSIIFYNHLFFKRDKRKIKDKTSRKKLTAQLAHMLSLKSSGLVFKPLSLLFFKEKKG